MLDSLPCMIIAHPITYSFNCCFLKNALEQEVFGQNSIASSQMLFCYHWAFSPCLHVLRFTQSMQCLAHVVQHCTSNMVWTVHLCKAALWLAQVPCSATELLGDFRLVTSFLFPPPHPSPTSFWTESSLGHRLSLTVFAALSKMEPPRCCYY